MSRRRGLGCVLVVCMALLAGCASSQQEEIKKIRARAAHERGLQALGQHQRAEALSALQEAVSLDPEVPNYYDSLGLLLLDLGQIDQAIERFKKATEIDPKYADAHFHLGTALAEARRWEEAVGSYRTALALPTLTVPDFVHQNLGLALFNLKRYREAEQSLRFALGLDPEMQAAYYNLGLVLVAEDRREEARAAFEQARKLSPASPFGKAAESQLKGLADGG